MTTDKEKKLDNLFKQGLENPALNANFREDDWGAMEALLDNNKTRHGIVYWLPRISSAAAILLVAVVWFLIKHEDKPVIVKASPVKQHLHKQLNTPMPAVIQPQSSAQLGISATSIVAVNKNAANKSHQNKGAQSAGNSASAQLAGNFYLKNASKKGVSTKNGNHPKNDTGLQAENNNVILNNDLVLTASLPVLNLSDVDAGYSNSILPTFNKPVITQTKPGKAVKSGSLNRPQFAISVLASPDINGVSSFQNSQVGTNAGLLFSVGISKRFTISTGAIYAKKPYQTNFADYPTTTKFKTDPQTVSADCRVLDIPINIDYQVYNKSNNKFTIGTGLSSYIMLRENYHYNYASAYTYGPSDYNIANKNQHFLGVLNLDAGYSRRLNSKLSLDVQPYLKVPLTDIGYSKVKLQSTGVAVGITWNINRPK